MMIRFDGYYLEEPTEVHHGRSGGESSYSFNAFCFMSDGFLKISSKHELLDDLGDFVKKDFESDTSDKIEVEVKGNKILVKPSGQFENEFSLEIIDHETVFNTLSKKKMYFVPWTEIDGNPERSNAVMHKLFGPFYHNKYKVFYE